MNRALWRLAATAIVVASTQLVTRPSSALVPSRYSQPQRRPPHELLIGRWKLDDDVVVDSNAPPLEGDIFYEFDGKVFERIEGDEDVTLDCMVVNEVGSSAGLALDDLADEHADASISFPDANVMLFQFLPPDTFAPHHMRFHRLR